MAKAKPDTVSSKPLYEWFKGDRARRRQLVQAGYTDGRITNWKSRGIPRAEVGAIARLMGLNYEQYLVAAGEKVEGPKRVQEPAAAYGISDDALEIARAFDQLQPQSKEHIREQVFVYAVIDKTFPWLRHGRPIGRTYAAFEKWHVENITAQRDLQAQQIGLTPSERSKK